MEGSQEPDLIRGQVREGVTLRITGLLELADWLVCAAESLEDPQPCVPPPLSQLEGTSCHP